MNKPPVARDLLDRANKSKIPKGSTNTEPVKVTLQIPKPSAKEEQKIEETLQTKLNLNNEETNINKEEETKTQPSTNNQAPQQQKFMKRLQNSMRKFNNTDQNAGTNPTTNSTGTTNLTASKKGMTKVVQSKKILDTAKFLENKMLKTESSESQNLQVTEGNSINTEENKIIEEIHENNDNDNQNNTDHLNDEDGVNKTSVKTGVRKPTKKPIV